MGKLRLKGLILKALSQVLLRFNLSNCKKKDENNIKAKTAKGNERLRYQRGGSLGEYSGAFGPLTTKQDLSMWLHGEER